MEASEIRKMLRGFYDAYPTTRPPTDGQLEIWDRNCSAIPTEVAREAYNKWIAEHRKPPTVAEFLEACGAVRSARPRALTRRPPEPLTARQRARAGAMAHMLAAGLRSGRLPTYDEMVAELGPEDEVPRYRCP